MITRLGSSRVHSSRGAASMEYVGAFALVASLVVAVILSVPDTASASVGVIQQAICRVQEAAGAGGPCTGQPDPEDPPPPVDPDFDPKPDKCKVTEHGEKVNSEIKIAFVKFGENAGFIETTYSDGTVTYTATDGASLGVTGGFGTKLDIGKVERGAKVDFGAGVTFDYGSTWTFDNAEQAAEMREQLDDYLLEQEIIKHNPTYAIKLLWSDAKEPPKPPSQTVSSIEVEGRGRGQARAEPAVGQRPRREVRHPEPQAGRVRTQVRRQREVDPDQRHRVRQHHLHHRR